MGGDSDIDKKQKRRDALRRMRRAICNPKDKTFCGRDIKSWCSILVFYLIFYAVLIGVFYGQMSVFIYGMVNYTVPVLTGYQSLLQNTPGIMVYPRIDNTSGTFRLSIWANTNSFQTHINATYTMFNGYATNASTLKPAYQFCDVTTGNRSIDDVQIPCAFLMSTLGRCQAPDVELTYGRPCVFLKLNKIYGWLPDIVNSSYIPDPVVQCFGQNTADTENLGQPTYSPNFTTPDNQSYGRFSNVFFPYVGQKTFQSPFVAVQFPNIRRNVIVLVSCQIFGVTGNTNTVLFEIMVEDL